jgi:aminoglycoside phosphotransferase (APT) family kinase protein
MNSPDLLESRLRAVVARLVPGASDVADLRAIPGGASQEIWTFDAVTPDSNVPLILRRAPPGSRQHASAVGLQNEARLLELAGEAGVPVPGVRGILNRDDGLGEGFVMDRIAGETNSRRILRDAGFASARARLARQCGQALAQIHATPRGRLPPMRVALAREEVTHYRSEHARAGTPRPVFELAFQWLLHRMPQQPV